MGAWGWPFILKAFPERSQFSCILSHHPHKTSNYPRNSKGDSPFRRQGKPVPSATIYVLPLHSLLTQLQDLRQVKELLLASAAAVNRDNRTGCASLHPTECLAHSRHFATHRYRKTWLFQGEGSQSRSVPTSVLSVDPISCG